MIWKNICLILMESKLINLKNNNQMDFVIIIFYLLVIIIVFFINDNNIEMKIFFKKINTNRTKIIIFSYLCLSHLPTIFRHGNDYFSNGKQFQTVFFYKKKTALNI